MKKFITLLVIVASLNITAQESVLLRLNYKKGFKQLTKIEMIQDMGQVKSNTIMDMKTIVTDVKDGIFTTENTFEKIVTDSEGQGQKVHYDSSIKEDKMEPMAKMIHAQMKPIAESVLLMYFDELGKMTDVKIKSGSANAEQFKNSATMTFPKEKIKKGSKWSKKETIQGGLEVSYNYTVNDITSEFVVIDVTGSIDGVAKGNVKGQTTIYKDSGAMLKSDVVTTVDMMGQKMVSTIKVSTK